MKGNQFYFPDMNSHHPLNMFFFVWKGLGTHIQGKVHSENKCFSGPHFRLP